MVEDDLLAEIYLERENEYTLAGSIYKGRVTRVLPGMQSAFVDIGLERDAFLYVSDFMELEDSEDLDDVPTNRPVPGALPGAASSRSSERRSTFAAPEMPNHEHRARNSCRSWQPRHREALSVRSNRAITAVVCVDAAAVADAAASACRNRSSPVRQPRRRERLRVLIVPNATDQSGTRMIGRNVRIGRNESTGSSGRTGQNARAIRSSSSAPNTGRRRDTSPSFCRESRSPNISGWRQPRPAPARSNGPRRGPRAPADSHREIFADDEPIFAECTVLSAFAEQRSAAQDHEEPWICSHESAETEDAAQSAWDREQQAPARDECRCGVWRRSRGRRSTKTRTTRLPTNHVATRAA